MKSFIKQNEETKYEAEILKMFNLYTKSLVSKPGLNLKSYVENVYFFKTCKKLMTSQQEDSNQNSCSFLKCLKCLFSIKQIQNKLINDNTDDLEFLTKELIIYNLFKDFEDSSSKNGIPMNDVILLFNMLLYEFIPEILIINKDKTENAFVEMFIEEKEKEKMSHVSFNTFSKMIKATMLFLINGEKFKIIFDSLDFEGKNKILTAELVVCLNKIYRTLNENDKQNLRIKNLTEIIDISKVYMKKSDFYKLVIQVYIVKND